ncbi:MAG: hypothetical protein HKN25_05870 [Pyrinomonadaceae bacterium]|nr:hypothetical protein [Pyrinomonadaceae bacterium]
MKIRLTSVLIFAALAIQVSAQNNVQEKVNRIRKVYSEAAQQIAAAEKDEESGTMSPLAVNELILNKLNRSWAAVGNYKVVFRFYYRNKDEEPYPTELVKVTKNSEISARRYMEEFLFDTGGNLIFYFEISDDGETPLERRMYFDRGRAIRVVEDKSMRDKPTKADRSNTGIAMDKGRRIRELFLKSIKE